MSTEQKSSTGLAIVIIPAVLTAIVGLVAAYLSYRAGANAILIPLQATQTAEAKATLAAPTPSGNALQPPVDHANSVLRFDFENGLPPAMSLGVCDNTKEWFHTCRESPTRLNVVSGGYTGQQSLEAQIELFPDKEQVYSLRVPIDPPEFGDTLTANIYLPDAAMFSKISLAAHPKGEDYWVFSDTTPRKAGWLGLITDLQQFKTDKDIAIDEIHIDIFVRQGNQEVQNVTALLDDIELYFPLAKSYKTGP